MKCRNCGAKIKADDLRCPYCSYQNEKAAKRRYMGKLHEIHSGMKQLSEQPKKTLKYEIAVTMLLTLAGVVLAITYGFLWDAFTRGNSDVEIRKMNRSVQEEIAWKEENFPILDSLYEEYDYEAIIEFYEDRYTESGHCLYDWEHYALVEAINDYADVLEVKNAIEEGEMPDEYEIRYALTGALKLIYFFDEEMMMYDRIDTAEEDEAAIKAMADGAQEVLGQYLKLLPEDIEAIYADVNADDYISYSECQGYADAIYVELFAGKEEQ